MSSQGPKIIGTVSFNAKDASTLNILPSTNALSAGYKFDRDSIRDSSDWIKYKKQALLYNSPKRADSWTSGSNDFRLETFNRTQKCDCIYDSVVINFGNVTATYDSGALKSITVAWYPVRGANSYKVFFAENRNARIPPPLTSDPNVLKRSDNTTKFYDNTTATTNLSITHIITNITRDICAFVYAYSDIGGTNRITDYPLTFVKFINNTKEIFLGRATRTTDNIDFYFNDDNTADTSSGGNPFDTLDSKTL